jgi:hypothetical protein
VSVGRSDRTPAKHGLMNRIIGKEVGAANYNARIVKHLWLDLSAGDGIVPDHLAWERNCSPGLLAFHARNCRKPVDIILYEIKVATFDRLLSSLEERLPHLGYAWDGHAWRFGSAVRLQLLNESGAGASLYGCGNSTAVLALNDPNAITDWVMRETFATDVRCRTAWFRSISTMGCNPGGLKRLPLAERMRWFELVSQQEAALPAHQDLLLAAIHNDDSQWAYLICEAQKWSESIQRGVVQDFRQHGMEMDLGWYRSEQEQYQGIKERLFLRRTERGEAS